MSSINGEMSDGLSLNGKRPAVWILGLVLGVDQTQSFVFVFQMW